MHTLHYAAKRFALQRHTFVPVVARVDDEQRASRSARALCVV